jgi:hypothetical protein
MFTLFHTTSIKHQICTTPETPKPAMVMAGFSSPNHLIQVAGAVRIELTTFGFGDRRSAN